MSRRLNKLIEQKKTDKENILSIFMTAGFPEKDATCDILIALAESGVDFIELGMPFSDPIADGPIIQKASQKALDNGITIDEIFANVLAIRKSSNIPILLMGYLNPIIHYGLEGFFEKSAEVGVDGFILPDWPLEENQQYIKKLKTYDLDLIHLIAPNTPRERIKQIDQASTSFIYCVAYTGVTGQDTAVGQDTLDFLGYLKSNLSHPFMIGFGVKNNDDFKRYSEFANGVIVGSAFIKFLEETPILQRKEGIKNFVKSIRG